MRKIQKGLSFSQIEIRDLGKSLLFISLSFAIVQVGFSLDEIFIRAFIISSIAVGLGFVLHELAHKYVAQKFGCWSEFRANTKMLWFALILAAVFRFIFIAPGAVLSQGTLTKKERGLVSVAGPVTNLILAVVFIIIAFLYPSGLLGEIAIYGYKINSWLALFNLIPAEPFDGQKVYAWNRVVFFSAAIAAIVLVFFF